MVQFDAILEEVGPFGLYQKRVVVLIFLSELCVVLHTMSPVFIAFVPEYQCQSPIRAANKSCLFPEVKHTQKIVFNKMTSCFYKGWILQ